MRSSYHYFLSTIGPLGNLPPQHEEQEIGLISLLSKLSYFLLTICDFFQKHQMCFHGA